MTSLVSMTCWACLSLPLVMGPSSASWSLPLVMSSSVGWCFSSRVNENMPVSIETQLQLSSHEKTKPTYIVCFVGDTEQQNLLYRKKYYRPAFGNEIPQCRQKNISRGDLTTNVCYCFLFNPPIIFGRCLLGNVRSASSDDSSFLDLDRSSFLGDVI